MRRRQSRVDYRWDHFQLHRRHDLGFITSQEIFILLGLAKDVQLGAVYFTRDFLSFNLYISGLLYIEKISDGSQGWVPGWLTREIESDHRRAKNFKQRYQFLKALAEMDMAE